MNEPQIERRRRNLPHWTQEGSTYYVTFRLVKGSLTCEESQIVFDHILSGDGRFYRLGAAVVMPDHVHLLLRPLPGDSLARIMKGIQGPSARLINEHRNCSGTVWQDESWDRIMRDYQEYQIKLQYMADNAVKGGLVRQAEDYPFFYCRRE